MVTAGHLIGVNKMSAALLERALQICLVTSNIIQYVAYDFEIRHFGTIFGRNTIEYKTCFDLAYNVRLNYFSLEMS